MAEGIELRLEGVAGARHDALKPVDPAGPSPPAEDRHGSGIVLPDLEPAIAAAQHESCIEDATIAGGDAGHGTGREADGQPGVRLHLPFAIAFDGSLDVHDLAAQEPDRQVDEVD